MTETKLTKEQLDNVRIYINGNVDTSCYYVDLDKTISTLIDAYGRREQDQREYAAKVLEEMTERFKARHKEIYAHGGSGMFAWGHTFCARDLKKRATKLRKEGEA